MFQYCYVLLTALLASLIILPFLREWALIHGIGDKPNDRQVLSKAIPRIGGIAIFVAFLFSVLVFVEAGRGLRAILAGGAILFFTGLSDDLCGVSKRRKFLGEVGACLTTIVIGHFFITRLGNPFGLGTIDLPRWLAIPVTLFAVVGVIRVINLIDGLDGLAGGTALLAFAGFFVLGLQDGNQLVMALCAAAAGATCGFLRHNFYPARICMGNGGSLVIGFLLAFAAIALTQGPGAGTRPAIPVLILGLPIAEMVFLLGRRVFPGRGSISGGQDPAFRMVLKIGLPHRTAVLFLCGISLVWTAFLIVCRNWPEQQLLIAFAVVAAASYLVMFLLLRRKERRSLQHEPSLEPQLRSSDEKFFERPSAEPMPPWRADQGSPKKPIAA
jgi:UDP-GlcNAc:undecaprenyl-phosphate/decaprenyl-phosphate GlcNAc-1-phosphate transferase